MIFCVEDDNNIRDLLVYTLETTGFHARGLEDSQELWKALAEEEPELILLDIMLPGEDGYSILEKLKKSSGTRDIPIIMVTAKEAEFDKVRALEAGADDYITKPFGMMEFIARVKAVLRRSSRHGDDRVEAILRRSNILTNDDVISAGGIELDKAAHQVKIDGQEIELSYKEFELLTYFMENRGIVMTRDQILCHIWGYDFDGETRTVDVHVRTLRQKLGDTGRLIETVRGVGYRMADKGGTQG